ncbi:MAG: hypothetical protein M1816_005346 [Peltula sp. TS41687]|nr:MAG: hypothetical protein M1816_005346 [Peltula sp. TS41687]
MSSDRQHVALPPKLVLTSTRPISPTTTGNGPASTRQIVMTLHERQQLIDNLREEITGRARKLRTQCGVQAHNLRTKIERRVQRITPTVKKTKLGNLIAQYEAQDERRDPGGAQPTNGNVIQPAQRRPLPPPPPPILEDHPKTSKPSVQQEKQPRNNKRGTKRKSDEIDQDTDKENAVQMPEDLPIPKKRVKTTTTNTATAAAIANKNLAATRATSRTKAQPSQVLSPKSFNSRTLPPPAHSSLRGNHAPPPPPPPPRGKKVPTMTTTTARVLSAGMVEKAKSTVEKAKNTVEKAKNTRVPSTRAPAAGKKTAANSTTKITTTTAAGAGGTAATGGRKKPPAPTKVTKTTAKVTKTATAVPPSGRVLRKRT